MQIQNVKTIGLYNFEFDFIQLGIDVKAARELMGWSQEKLGKAIGYTSTFISGIETGRADDGYTIESFLAVCNFLQLDPSKYWTLYGKPYSRYTEGKTVTYEIVSKVE